MAECSCNTTSCSGEEIIFEIDEKVCMKLQAEYYTYTGLLNILTQFTSDSVWKPDDKRYEEVLNEYLTSFAKYSVLFDSVRYRIIKENNLDTSILGAETYVEFQSNTIKFIKK